MGYSVYQKASGAWGTRWPWIKDAGAWRYPRRVWVKNAGAWSVVAMPRVLALGVGRTDFKTATLFTVGWKFGYSGQVQRMSTGTYFDYLEHTGAGYDSSYEIYVTDGGGTDNASTLTVGYNKLNNWYPLSTVMQYSKTSSVIYECWLDVTIREIANTANSETVQYIVSGDSGA